MLVQPSCCLKLFYQSKAASCHLWSSLYLSVAINKQTNKVLLLHTFQCFRWPHFWVDFLRTVKHSTWQYQITVCLADRMWGRERKIQTRWLYIAKCTKSFIHTVSICAGGKVPRWGKKDFSRRPGRLLSIWKNQQLHLMIHKASEHQKRNQKIRDQTPS